jgi:hypothetical protein
MSVRDLRDSDLPQLEAMHRQQGYDYPLPDFRDAEFVSKQVVVDEHDRPYMVLVARRTVELYLLCDPGYGTPGLRWMAIKTLRDAMSGVLKALGFTDVHAWIPPAIEKSFTRRLKRMGWTKAAWNCYARKVE